MRHVIAYLLTDTLKRWREQPWSPLARLLVAFLVSGAALAVLGAFDAAERVVVAKMRHLGVNTIFVTRTLPGATQINGERYEWLAEQGNLLVLIRPYIDGIARSGLRVEVSGYTANSLNAISRTAGASNGATLLVTDTIPAGIAETVKLPDGAAVDTTTVAPTGVFRLVPRQAQGGALLMPATAIAASVATNGGVETVVFERSEQSAVSLAACVEALKRLSEMEGGAMRVTSSLDLSKELANVQESKRLWSAILCGLFGVTLVLVFGAMAGLEYRESRFLAALLRSMGARSWILVCRQAAEAACVANLGGILALAALEALRRNAAQFSSLGFDATQFILSTDSTLAVFGGLTVGALCASVPVVIALRKPIGVVLG